MLRQNADVITVANDVSLSGVEAWAREIRHASGSDPHQPIALDAAVVALDLKIVYSDLPPTLWGATWGGTYVALNRRLPRYHRRFALAHELAHVGVARGKIASVGSDEEWAWDWFAREVLLPVRDLAQSDLSEALTDQAGLVALAAWWKVPECVVLLQAARAGRAPAVQILDGRVLCVRCGDRTRLPGCTCPMAEQQGPERRVSVEHISPHLEERSYV